MAEGTIDKLTNVGFGFIKTRDERSLFFFYSSLQGVSFHELEVGQKVSYTEVQGPKGPHAENVTPVDICKLIAGNDGPGVANSDRISEGAIAEIQRLGGRVAREKKSPVGPVVSVRSVNAQ